MLRTITLLLLLLLLCHVVTAKRSWRRKPPRRGPHERIHNRLLGFPKPWKGKGSSEEDSNENRHVVLPPILRPEQGKSSSEEESHENGHGVLPPILRPQPEKSSSEEKNTPNKWVCGEDCNSTVTGCYQFISNPMSWADAEFFCKGLIREGHLASVHSKEENEFIVTLIKKAANSDRQVWIGGSDCYKDQNFVWTDGSEWDFENWQEDKDGGKGNTFPFPFPLLTRFPRRPWTRRFPPHPQNFHVFIPHIHKAQEPCIRLNFKQPGVWDDIRCEIRLPFVCKYEGGSNLVG
nr:PREDICTED: aggrecan core protein-like [Latimeria chalumnae]|eukprot:XP_006013988.1 PREDICTED: aggrecan core protein-like [Latimeria chalumnae]